ncbi:hypothetical protein [Kaistella yonginensis]|uniref:hypothetical protein n=1 Tax=Kaistella yonginensis TaxID=658267 RepID=UPI0025B54AFC|nr:hypothetical protein [Kaistella yonginensis]MDN3605328.1 hypothetical protein [Kaistella yonginensis]
MATYKFTSLIEIDKEFKIDGLNIWNYYWHCSERKLEVRGPFEGNIYFFNEYEIRTPEKTIVFVAGEFSTGQIGIYLREENAMAATPLK